MKGRIKYETVKQYIEEYNCILLTLKDDYKNTGQNLDIICSCGRKFKRCFHDFKRRNGHMCTHCKSGTHRWSYEEVRAFVESKGGKLLSKEYPNSREKLKLQCECGRVYERNFKNFKDGKNYKCPRCGYKSTPYDEVKETLGKLGCKLLDKEYVNNQTPMLIECKCGEKFLAPYSHFIYYNRQGCYKCTKSRKHTYEDVSNFIKEVGCELISTEYVNNSTKLKVKCRCGKVFNRRFGTFKDGKAYYCRECSQVSKGEQKTKDSLFLYNIEFVEQYKFKECKFKKELPFDFYLPKYNICIEYDGRQHFEIVKKFGGLEGFIDTKIRDTIKNTYCKKNNIKLIRIPYWDFNNIEKILKKELRL